MQNSDFPNLPKSWQVKTLGEVCEKISAGGDRPNDCTAEKTQENQIPIFSNGIENNGLYGYTKTPTITKPALTISARGTIGFVCVRYEPFFPIVRLICAIPNDKMLVLEFLAYALRYLIPQGEGSSIPQLTIPNFKQIKIPIPPLEIQKRIVKRLDEAFSRIESGTKHLKSAKDNLIKYKQSLLKSAFEGTLTNDSLNGESANLPQGWTIKTLGEIGEIITGSTPNTKNKEYYGNEYPFYKPTDLNSGYFVENSSDMVSSKGFEISRKLPPKSILVTCIGATIGKTGFIRNIGICNQQINAIIAKQNICPEFVYFSCISNAMQELIKTNASATTLPILNKTAFSKLPIPIPPLEIQKQIVEILERHFTSADKVSAYIDSCLSKAKQLKSSLLKSAFAGELV